jgi:hypothetical protein
LHVCGPPGIGTKIEPKEMVQMKAATNHVFLDQSFIAIRADLKEQQLFHAARREMEQKESSWNIPAEEQLENSTHFAKSLISGETGFADD